MKCLLRRKSCKPAWQWKGDGGWYCSGVKTRCSPGGATKDVISLCGYTFFHKPCRLIECTPDEAAKFSAAFGAANSQWFEGQADYHKEYIEGNELVKGAKR